VPGNVPGLALARPNRYKRRMGKILERIFRLSELGTTAGRELVAGATTFVTMSYIIVVNPKILEAAGIPFGPGMVATILAAFLGSLAMGLYANRPFAVAPYMGENAFVAFTVVKVLGYDWRTALGATFIGGVLFLVLTILGAREWLIRSLPEGLKRSFAMGIGLFLTFIGLSTTGIVTLGVPGAPVQAGSFHDPKVLLAAAGFFITVGLMAWRVRGAIILGILIVTGLSFVFGVAAPPARLVSEPPSIAPVLLALNVPAAFAWGLFSVILTIFVMAFVDTMGSIYAVSYRADLLDERGDLPDIHRPLLVDALATVVAAALGTTTSGIFIESATGIEEGGRSGLTAVVVACLFLSALFIEPFLTSVPACAYGPSLIVVGLLMMTAIREIDFTDLSETVPAFLTIVLMSFTYNIGIGMTAGFVAYPLMKLVTGRVREVAPGLWVLAGLSALFFVFYPH
jgi:AGZA family xanthine/uracil permease-like MFS transporter